jgi:hypothetical protein
MVAGSPRDLHLAGWLRRGARADGGDGARVSAAARRRREGSGGLGKGLTGPCWLCLAGRVAVCRIYPCEKNLKRNGFGLGFGVTVRPTHPRILKSLLRQFSLVLLVEREFEAAYKSNSYALAKCM